MNNPNIILAPAPTFKFTSNIKSDTYGGVGTISDSTLRMNFKERIDSIMKERNLNGLSGGVEKYVNCLYDTVPNSKIVNPNPCGGYRNLNYAYGNQENGYCIKRLDEY